MAKPIIAVFNSSDDTVEMLRTALEADGLHTVPGHIGELEKGELDFVAFVEHHRPAVILYDISLPYDTNWTFLKLVRSSQPAQACRFVLTTTNKPALDKLVGEYRRDRDHRQALRRRARGRRRCGPRWGSAR